MRSLVHSLAAVAVMTVLSIACGGSLSTTETSAADGGVGSSDNTKPDGPQADSGSPDVVVLSNDAGSLTKLDASVTKPDASTRDGGTCSSAKEGDPCATNGERCAPSPCTNACQFCNLFECSQGKWEVLEAFPLPPTQCASTFPCGNSTCTSQSYCVARYPGGQLADGGVPAPTLTCLPFDSNCIGGCGCAMQAATKMSSCTPTVCDAPDGGPIVSCYGL